LHDAQGLIVQMTVTELALPVANVVNENLQSALMFLLQGYSAAVPYLPEGLVTFKGLVSLIYGHKPGLVNDKLLP
jgi:hypothetical protein